MKETAFLAAVLVLGACASAPSTERPQLPDRPDVPRPDGAEPEGLAEMRDVIAGQRAAARERTNALDLRPNELSTHPGTPWYRTLLAPFDAVLGFLGF